MSARWATHGTSTRHLDPDTTRRSSQYSDDAMATECQSTSSPRYIVDPSGLFDRGYGRHARRSVAPSASPMPEVLVPGAVVPDYRAVGRCKVVRAGNLVADRFLSVDPPSPHSPRRSIKLRAVAPAGGSDGWRAGAACLGRPVWMWFPSPDDMAQGRHVVNRGSRWIVTNWGPLLALSDYVVRALE
jgi:hypothetical protein